VKRRAAKLTRPAFPALHAGWALLLAAQPVHADSSVPPAGDKAKKAPCPSKKTGEKEKKPGDKPREEPELMGVMGSRVKAPVPPDTVIHPHQPWEPCKRWA
jgi:hypothetical protein